MNLKMSIFFKIVLMNISLLLLSIVIPAVLVFVNSQSTIIDTTIRELEQTSLLTQNALRSWIDFLKMDIQTLSKFKAIQSSTNDSFIGKATRKGASQQLIKKLEDFKFYETLSVVDQNGQIVVSTDEDIVGQLITDKSFFNQSLSGKTVVSSLTLNDKTKNVNFIVSSPIYGQDKTIGVVFGRIDLGYFEKDFIYPVKIGTSGYVGMTSADGVYLSHPDRSNLMKVKLTEFVFGREILEKKDGLRFYQWKGDEQLAVYKSVPELGWIIVVTAVSSELLAPVNKLTLINALISIAILILAVVFSIIFGQKIRQSLFSSVKLISEISAGKFDKRMNIATGDEIETMANEMNNLAADFQSAVTDINDVIGQVAVGNLSNSVQVELKGDLDKLKYNINKSIGMLNHTITQVAATTEQVKTGTDEILSAAENLASGNSQQAASLEEISSSMNEIEAQTVKNDENASKAKNLVSETLQTVMDGNSRMNHMQKSMEKINETSANVSKVIKVIDEIAFQTNLLALNAAVEAARAGKYGKGFAVVADEVRNLAGRSAEAARNTTELIETSIKEVDKGVVSSDQTATVLSEITISVEKINNFISEIAAASTDQKQSISEINKGLSQVNSVVQQNSSISEETSTSAKELSAITIHLLKLIQNFTLKHEKTQSRHQIEQSVQLEQQSPNSILLTEPEVRSTDSIVVLDNNGFKN